MKVFVFVTKVVLVMATTMNYASAYLEPGVVSMILQGLVAGLMVVATTIGVYWQKFLSLVHKVTGKDFSKSESTEDEPVDKQVENEGQ